MDTPATPSPITLSREPNEVKNHVNHRLCMFHFRCSCVCGCDKSRPLAVSDESDSTVNSADVRMHNFSRVNLDVGTPESEGQ